MGVVHLNRRELNLQCCIIEITLRCNFRCIHCGSYAGKLRKDELSKQEIFKVIDDLKTIGCRQITLMGGELFLREDWYEIAQYVNSNAFDLVLISNGWFLTDPKRVKKIAELNPYTVVLSLDGGESVHDKIRGVPSSFKHVMESIVLLQEARIPLGVITTINKLNVNELRKIKKLLYSLLGEGEIRWQIQTAGYGRALTENLLIDENDYLAICRFIDKAQSEKQYDPAKLLIKGADDIGYNQTCLSPFIAADHDWHGCKAGINVLGVQSNGNVKGCLSLSDDFIEANIREKSIVDIWNDKNSFSYSRKFKVEDLGENCVGCIFGEKCKGGCNDISFSRTGKIANAPFCLHRIEQRKAE